MIHATDERCARRVLDRLAEADARAPRLGRRPHRVEPASGRDREPSRLAALSRETCASTSTPCARLPPRFERRAATPWRLSGWGVRAWRRRRWPPCNAPRARPRLVVLDSTHPAAVRRALDELQPGSDVRPRLDEVGHDDGDPGAVPRGLRSRHRCPRSRGCGQALRRHHRPRKSARRHRARSRIPPHVPERPDDRRTLRRVVARRPRPGCTPRPRSGAPPRRSPNHGRSLLPVNAPRARTQPRSSPRSSARMLPRAGTRRRSSFPIPSRASATGSSSSSPRARASTARDSFPSSESRSDRPSVYGGDRVFVHLGPSARTPEPIVTAEFGGPEALGGQFFLWEMATALLGHLLGVNPFDQPDVESAKRATRRCSASTTPAQSRRGRRPH